MSLKNLLHARLKACFRDPFSFVFIILAIIISIAAAVIAQEKIQSSLLVAIVSEDAGEYGQKLVLNLSENESFSMREMSREDAMRLLNQDRLETVIIICSDFSEKIGRGEFRNTLELYTSPSSQATATISEPLINGVMMLWMEEQSVIRAKSYLSDHGEEYDSSDEAVQRSQIQALWDSGAVINIKNVALENESETSDFSIAFASCVRWYGGLCLFYFIVGASWVLDTSKKNLGIRVRQTGAKQWKIIITTCMAPLIICVAGYLIAGASSSALTGASIWEVAVFFVPMLIYLASLLGLTLLIASLARNILSLMFLAPVFTFFCGVISGLLITLPGWTYVLSWFSRALPGRWFSEFISAQWSAVPFALLCCAVWIGVGICVSLLQTKRG